jgi:transposase InsO family protein
MKFSWIKAHQREFPVAPMCQVLEVSKSGFYAWLRRPPSARAQRSALLVERIGAVHRDSRQLYGSPRVHRELLAQGESVAENTVAKLMHLNDIRSKIARRFVPHTTDANHPYPVAENLLNRDFKAPAPNRKWVTDITYVETAEGWLYVSAVLDLYSRKIVGWSMARHLRTELVSEALKMAFVRRKPRAGLLHHSDRGVQYASSGYQDLLAQNGCVCSMSRSGNCYDNAAMESFWGTLKTELLYQQKFATHAQAKAEIFEYIEVFYNRKRRHSSLNYQSPEAFEAALN